MLSIARALPPVIHLSTAGRVPSARVVDVLEKFAPYVHDVEINLVRGAYGAAVRDALLGCPRLEQQALRGSTDELEAVGGVLAHPELTHLDLRWRAGPAPVAFAQHLAQWVLRGKVLGLHHVDVSAWGPTAAWALARAIQESPSLVEVCFTGVDWLDPWLATTGHRVWPPSLRTLCIQ